MELDFSPVDIPRINDKVSGINLSIDDILNGTDIAKPYDVLFYELGHNIDRLAYFEKYKDISKDNDLLYSEVFISKKYNKSIYEMLVLEFEKIKLDYKNDIINSLRIDVNDKDTLSSIADEIIYINIRSQYINIGKDTKVSIEFFTEVISSLITNIESYELINRYFSKSCEIYFELLNNILGGN